MSEDKPHGATTVHASKGGGGAAKWLVGGLTAVALAGGGYYAYKNYAPQSEQTDVQSAYNDAYSEESATGEPAHAAPLPLGPGAAEESSPGAGSPAAGAPGASSHAAAPTSEPRRAAPVRRATRASAARAQPAEETIGITPISATTSQAAAPQDEEHVIVTARRPVWSRMPSERRLSALYPTRALERGREGEASLHCMVLSDGALDCARVSETQRDFGAAAMRISRTLRHAPHRADGSDAAGTAVNLRVVFQIDDDARGQRFASR